MSGKGFCGITNENACLEKENSNENARLEKSFVALQKSFVALQTRMHVWKKRTQMRMHVWRRVVFISRPMSCCHTTSKLFMITFEKSVKSYVITSKVSSRT